MSTFQRKFFNRLGERLSPRSKLVAEVGSVLHVGRDAVYRRIRGETVLSADEMYLLAQAFDLPIEQDKVISMDIPLMYYPSGKARIENGYDFFRQLADTTKNVIYLPEVTVDFASPELPIYYEMSLPTLRSFKIFMYSITTWDMKELRDTKFSTTLIAPQVHQVVERMLENAYKAAGRELWSISILDVTLRQITYFAQVGRFANQGDIDKIFEELFQIIDHLESMCRSGKRYQIGTEPTEDSPDFKVYHNELSNTNSVILVNSATENLVFNNLVNPNYLISSDPRVVRDVNIWFDNLVYNATSLNRESIKYAAQYFDRLRQQVNATKERIKFGSIIF